MKTHIFAAAALILGASSAGCASSSRATGPDGGPTTGPGSTTGDDGPTTAPTTNTGGGGSVLNGATTAGHTGGTVTTTGGFGGTSGTVTGLATTGMVATTGGATGGTGVFTTGGIADAGIPPCDGSFCCDDAGNCCIEPLGLCTGPDFGGTPGFTTGGTVAEAGPPPVQTTDAPWDAPVQLEPRDPESPAWRDSSEPLCTERQQYVSTHALWSDERGVFVLVGGGGFGGLFGGPFPFPVNDGGMGDCEDCPRLTLWFNDGSGWARYNESREAHFFAEHQLAGLAGGPLFAHGQGGGFEGPGCGLATVGEASFECEPVSHAPAVSAVNAQLAYAVAEGNLIQYRDGRWGPYPGVLNDSANLTTLWAADESTLFGATSSGGQWLELVDGQWLVLDTGTLERFQAMWGFSADDVYAGTREGGLFHYDGSAVTEVDWPHQRCRESYPEGIRHLWGADGVLYFHTATQLAKLQDGEVEVIAEWPCERTDEGQSPPSITSIWGNGPDELFVALKDQRTPRQECGVTFVLYYDGTAFHRL